MAVPDLSPLRARFPALARTQDGMPVVFADAPGGSQVPDTVIDAVATRYRMGASNMDGAFVTSREIEATVDAARRAAADLLGAEPERIVFGPNATSLLVRLRAGLHAVAPSRRRGRRHEARPRRERPAVGAGRPGCRRHGALGGPCT